MVKKSTTESVVTPNISFKHTNLEKQCTLENLLVTGSDVDIYLSCAVKFALLFSFISVLSISVL